MVIDTHIHPALFAPICEDQERFRRRCDAMNYHLMKPSDMALLRKQYALADIGRVVLLPEDCSVESGMVEIDLWQPDFRPPDEGSKMERGLGLS